MGIYQNAPFFNTTPSIVFNSHSQLHSFFCRTWKRFYSGREEVWVEIDILLMSTRDPIWYMILQWERSMRGDRTGLNTWWWVNLDSLKIINLMLKSTDRERRLFRMFSFNNILVNKTKRGEFSTVIEDATHRFLTCPDSKDTFFGHH